MEKSHSSHDENVYKKFKQQLDRNNGGWYQTGLLSTENKVPLNKNKYGSLGRLNSLLKLLQQNPETFKAYYQVIRGQLVNNKIEKISKNQSKKPKGLFLPHRPVIRQNVESTKLRAVYDSAKSVSGYSINDCLGKGPTLQKKLWDTLIRGRFRQVILCTDIDKAFLQIRIIEKERESP